MAYFNQASRGTRIAGREGKYPECTGEQFILQAMRRNYEAGAARREGAATGWELLSLEENSRERGLVLRSVLRRCACIKIVGVGIKEYLGQAGEGKVNGAHAFDVFFSKSEIDYAALLLSDSHLCAFDQKNYFIDYCHRILAHGVHIPTRHTTILCLGASTKRR